MKTLVTLKDYPKDKIKIFVISEEYELYKNLNPEYEIIVGVLGVANQRQFIKDYFEIGSEIVYMDDDITEIDVPNIEEFIKNAFIKCHELKANIWGIYPVYNPFFRKDKITTDLRFIIGCFYGIINTNIEKVICNNKDDVERTIQYYKRDGIVIRYNNIGVKTKFYAKGGLGLLKERMPIIVKEVDYLELTYPEYGKRFIRKNRIHEFKLHKKL